MPEISDEELEAIESLTFSRVYIGNTTTGLERRDEVAPQVPGETLRALVRDLREAREQVAKLREALDIADAINDDVIMFEANRRLSELSRQLAAAEQERNELRIEVAALRNKVEGAACECAVTSESASEEPRQAVRDFALLMEQRLQANDYKGGWGGCESAWLFKRLLEEVFELEEALNTGTNVQHEAADVANIAMMMADIASSSRDEATNK